MNNRERDAFEAWAKPFFFSLIRALRDTDEYDSLTTQAAWMAWQARAALGVGVGYAPGETREQAIGGSAVLPAGAEQPVKIGPNGVGVVRHETFSGETPMPSDKDQPR